MSGLRNRALEFFVAPDPQAATAERRPRVGRVALEPRTAGVLGAAKDVGPVAQLLTAELRLRFKARCVLVAEWDAVERSSGRPAAVSGPARPLVSRLAARDLDVSAQGRSVIVRLPSDPPAAGRAWRQALAAADCPALLALTGPRPSGLDPVISELDLIVFALGAGASMELGRLAVAGLAVRTPAHVVPSPGVSKGIARLMASSSVATSRLLGTEVTRAVGELA